MAYTGTGTQADPFIPTTITSLYDVLDICNNDESSFGVAGYYIKLTSNIDCANDPNYVGYSNTPITLSSYVNKLYSDNGYKIIGLCVKAQYFINAFATADNYVIDNIDFENCFWKPSTTGVCFYLTSSGSSTDASKHMYRVTASIYVAASDDNTQLISFQYGSMPFSTIEESSLYFDLGNSVNIDCSQQNFMFSHFINTNIIITNAYLYGIGGQPYIITAYLNNGSPYNSFIFKNCFVYVNSSGDLNLIANLHYSYAAFIDCTFGNCTAKYFQCEHCVVASDNYTNVGHSDETNVINYLTIQELQDNQKLIDIGFLP